MGVLESSLPCLISGEARAIVTMFYRGNDVYQVSWLRGGQF